MEKSMGTLGAGLIAIGVAVGGLFIGGSIVKFKKLDRSVEVRGLAERVVESDQAIWTMTYSAPGEQLAEVNGKVLQIQATVLKFLDEQGFTNEEIQKQPANISDRVTQEYGNNKGPRFIGRGNIIVSSKRVKEVTAASQKTDELLKRGIALASSNVAYYFTDLNSIKPAMLEEATRSAREAAEGFAKNANANVGGIRKATQGLFSIGSPLLEYDSGSSLQKKVRVVTQVDFYLE